MLWEAHQVHHSEVARLVLGVADRVGSMQVPRLHAANHTERSNSCSAACHKQRCEFGRPTQSRGPRELSHFPSAALRDPTCHRERLQRVSVNSSSALVQRHRHTQQVLTRRYVYIRLEGGRWREDGASAPAASALQASCELGRGLTPDARLCVTGRHTALLRASERARERERERERERPGALQSGGAAVRPLRQPPARQSARIPGDLCPSRCSQPSGSACQPHAEQRNKPVPRERERAARDAGTKHLTQRWRRAARVDAASRWWLGSSHASYSQLTSRAATGRLLAAAHPMTRAEGRPPLVPSFAARVGVAVRPKVSSCAIQLRLY